MMTKSVRNNQTGFALLLTLVVVSVILAIGLTLVDITIKQLTISGTGRDSEIAYQAAYAGSECAQYWRYEGFRNDPTDYTPPVTWCMDFPDSVTTPSTGNSDVYHTQVEIDWTSEGENRCTQFDMYVFDDTAGNGVVYDIQEFDPGVDEECNSGSSCTFVLSRGYNRACGSLATIGVVQREVRLQF